MRQGRSPLVVVVQHLLAFVFPMVVLFFDLGFFCLHIDRDGGVKFNVDGKILNAHKHVESPTVWLVGWVCLGETEERPPGKARWLVPRWPRRPRRALFDCRWSA